MRRLVIGGASAALATAMAMLAPTGASASPVHHTTDRTAPSAPTAGKPTPSNGTGPAAAAAAANALVRSKPDVVEASKYDAFQAGNVISSNGLYYVPYQRTYRGIPVVGGDFVVATDANGRILATSVAQTAPVDLGSITASVRRVPPARSARTA